MRKMFACLTILTCLCSIPAMAATTTLAGVITDDKCAGKHKGMDKDDAACVRACVKRGANFAIVADGKLYILSGKSTELGALAGQKASVSGDLKGNILTVSSVEAAK